MLGIIRVVRLRKFSHWSMTMTTGMDAKLTPVRPIIEFLRCVFVKHGFTILFSLCPIVSMSLKMFDVPRSKRFIAGLSGVHFYRHN